METELDEVRLTALSHGAGCACKIGAAELAPVLERLPQFNDPNLLVDSKGRDDAAVYRLSDELALVCTVDFFTPIVDDPYDFGRIAAANALSDVYAMGAQPLLALNVVGLSLGQLGEPVLEGILAGGAEVAREAGIAIGGGHSIDDPEPKYGMAVIGSVHPDRLLTNAGAQVGDALYLTKPLGSGLVTTAAKHGLADPEIIVGAISVMTTLNARASHQALAAGAHAATDVTGFGLLGHLHELCLASQLAAEIEAERVPAIDGVLDLAREPRCLAGGSRRNGAYAQRFATWADSVDPQRRVLLYDAMTSGGLLIAVRPERRDQVPGVRIGQLVEGIPGRITVV